MSELLGKVFNVSRVPASTHSVQVGDFKTLEEAKTAMIEHYKNNPKRGKFVYRIAEEEIEEIGGAVFRKFSMTIGVGESPYYKKFSMDELKEMI